MDISGKTRVCGVIGDPIEHTLSPIMHNAAFHAQKFDYTFLAFKVKPAELENAVNGMRSVPCLPMSPTVNLYGKESNSLIKARSADLSLSGLYTQSGLVNVARAERRSFARTRSYK